MLKKINTIRIIFFRSIAYRTLKALLLIKLMLDKNYSKKLSFNSNLKSILLLLHGGIGDAVVSSGFIKELSNYGIKVLVLAPKHLETFFNDLMPYCTFIPYNTKKTYQTDLIINPYDPDPRDYHILKCLLRISFTSGIFYNQHGIKLFDNIANLESVHFNHRYQNLLQIMKEHFSNLSKLNLELNMAKRYSLNVSSEYSDEVASWVAHKIDKPLIVINCAASDPIRSFSPTLIIQLTEALLNSHKYSVAIFNCPEQTKQEINKQNRTSGVFFSPFQTLPAIVALLFKAHFLITPDTSFVHLAHFTATKSLSIYNNRLCFFRYDNNKMWGPDYPQGGQFFTSDKTYSDIGDDVRKLSFDEIAPTLHELQII